jgi:hypothetical protein
MIRLGFACAVALLLGCSHSPESETIDVSLSVGERFEHPTVGGDEEGARIVRQAEHSAVSEIRRNAETNWVAIYSYQPAAGYVGSDRAEIEVTAGSDGASAPTRITRIVFRFTIHE